MDDKGTGGTPPTQDGDRGRRAHARLLGAGVASRSGSAGTPASPSWWKRWLLGYSRPAYPGIAEIGPGDVDPQTHQLWAGYLREPPAEPEERIGISCSGGGIRAASFVLGALQSLRETGVLERADHLASVSGGGYTATGLAAMVGLTREQAPDDATAAALLSTPPPWALDAPETVNLRNHTHYLAPNLRGTVWGVVASLYGTIRHLLPFAALIVGAGMVYGWVLTWLPHLVIPTAHTPGNVDVAALRAIAVFGCGVPIGLGVLLVAIRVYQERSRPFPTGDDPDAAEDASARVALHVVLETWSTRLVLTGVVAGLALCAVPRLLSVIVDDVPHLLPALGPVLAGIPGYTLLLQRGKSLVSQSPKRVVRAVMVVVTYAGGMILVLLSFLLATYLSASRGPGPRWEAFNSATWFFLCAGYLVATGVLTDEMLNPLHILYRERLSTAFIRYRTDVRRGVVGSAEPPWSEAVRFSTLRLGGAMPKLAICASVNVADDVVPPGRLCGSFTFEQDWSGGPLTGYVRTPTIEQAAGDALTMPGMMTVAGAAFSPLMGRDTRPGFRLLLALFGVRLGMWLPNPRFLPKATTARQAGSGRPTTFFDSIDTKRFTGTGAVAPPSRMRRPGWAYALYEALGLNHLSRPYVYITDGGHWENLGLVELLRRGCTQIVCLDASEDGQPPLQALGDAMALARDELNVRIDIDVRDLMPGSANDPTEARLTRSSCAAGTIHYPDGRPGVLVIAKNVLPADAPHDVRVFAGKNPRFPLDSTLNQFFDDLHFDAYRTLGEHAACCAAAELARCSAPPAQPTAQSPALSSSSAPGRSG